MGIVSMEKQYSREIRYNGYHKELILSQRDLTTVSAEIIATFANCTEYLDLSHNRIACFNWIYEFRNLKFLILDCNRLNESHLQQLKQPLEKIKVLMLNKNELTDFNIAISLLSHIFPNLEYLSLHGNPICPDGLYLQPFCANICFTYDYYRSLIMSSFSKLNFLDHCRVQRDFVVSLPQSRVYTLTFTHKMLWAKLKSLLPTDFYNPLPPCPQRYVGYHFSSIRRISDKDHVYKGQDSEGNRYISNDDL